ncbi:MAG TPA: hypothetical protein VF469_33215 [Kofleriaceae bacterium]
MTRSRLVLAGIVVLAVGVAWLIRWGCDDAYISFTYARSLVRGDGLTWFGDRIEGYTNFAWVLWVAGGIAAGVDPLVWAWGGSLISLAVAIVATYRIVRLRGGGTVTAACAAGLLATNFTFLAFGTSGLETMLQTALLAIAWWQVEDLSRSEPTPRRLALISVACALAIWTRLDSAVICAVLSIPVIRRIVRAGIGPWLTAIAPAAVLLGAWLGWKLAYYGDLLPNTFHTKVSLSPLMVTHGAKYAGAFLHAYLLWPALLAVAALATLRRSFPHRMPAAIAGAWLAYVVLVGGDFMEFRFLVPAMPALFTIIAEAVTIEPAPAKLPRPPIRAIATVGLLAALSWRHAATFQGAADTSYDSVHAMATFYDWVPDGAWQRPGLAIRAALAGTGATLACNGAGAIPYFADLYTVDQLGLNDAWVARHGAQPPDSYLRPGHRRFATYEYLALRKVTFVIGTPQIVPRGAISSARSDRAPAWWPSAFLGAAARPISSFLVVAVPLDDGRELVMWYLTPTDEITARVRAAGWEMRRFAS